MRYGLAILFAMICARPAAAQLDAIFADWSARYDELSTVEYVAEGVVITTPDFITGLGTPTQDLPDDPLPAIFTLSSISSAVERGFGATSISGKHIKRNSGGVLRKRQ